MLTVWLKIDPQSGWPDIVAATNAQFQKDDLGWTVEVQYQNWGDHLCAIAFFLNWWHAVLTTFVF